MIVMMGGVSFERYRVAVVFCGVCWGHTCGAVLSAVPSLWVYGEHECFVCCVSHAHSPKLFSCLHVFVVFASVVAWIVACNYQVAEKGGLR
jgi:hypothetical protein